MTLYIAPIVEGQTEVGCLTSLLRRIWSEVLSASEPLQVLQPSRGNRDQLIAPQSAELTKKVEEAFVTMMRRVSRDASGRGMLLLLVDAEKDCPKKLASSLLTTAQKSRSDADIACVIPKWTLENWIVAGASTLAGVNGLPDPIPERDQFEGRSGVAWLHQQLRSKNRARTYKKVADSKTFVQTMNLAECRANCPSFDKLCRELAKRLLCGETSVAAANE